MRSFLVLLAVRQACGECYGADVSTFTWCSGYDGAGYSCNGNMCANENCVADCMKCAVQYPNAVLHAASGRCCDELSEDGSCKGPKDGLAPKNEDYGFPDRKPSLIVEGAAAFPNGAPIWSDDHRDGAYGFTWNTPSGKRDADCPAIPDDATFDRSKVRPANMKEHGAEQESCFLSCDVSEIEKTGVDPCAAGSRPDIGIKMGCYYGGETWLTPSTMGICGYPCQLINDDMEFCSQDEHDARQCYVSCDPRDLGTAASPSQIIKASRQNGSLLV